MEGKVARLRLGEVDLGERTMEVRGEGSVWGCRAGVRRRGTLEGWGVLGLEMDIGSKRGRVRSG